MRTLALLVGTTLVLTSCGSGGFRTRTFPSVAALMEASEALYRTSKCGDAEIGFRRVTNQLPVRDSVAVRARFLLAECQFTQSFYLDAARQFRRVADEAPNHHLAPFALLRSGDAQRRLWRRPELDPTYAQAAVTTFQEVIARYPRTDVARRASQRLVVLSNQFAEKEYKNGMYYFRVKAYDSAIIYFRGVVSDFGSTAFAPLAMMRLVEIYQRLEYRQEEQDTCQNLRRFYPTADGLDELCPVAP